MTTNVWLDQVTNYFRISTLFLSGKPDRQKVENVVSPKKINISTFFKNGPIPAFFVYFISFLVTISIIQIDKSVEGVRGIRTRVGRYRKNHRAMAAPLSTNYFLGGKCNETSV